MMFKSILIHLLFLTGSGFYTQAQILSDQLLSNDSLWRYTHSDTISNRDGFLVFYYDSLALHYDYIAACSAGYDDFDAENCLTRKQRILPNGFSYAIDYYNGIPAAGGYGNNQRSAYIQWHLNGQLQFIVNYLKDEKDLEGAVRDGISIMFDEHGNIMWYGVYSNDILVLETNQIQK